jgi:hypothetical protein
MILQLCILLLSLFLYVGFGLPAAAWLRRIGAATLLLTPTLGIAALTLFVTWLYLAGLDALAIGVAAAVLSLISLALFRGTVREILAQIGREPVAALLCLGFCLILAAPILTGRLDFTISRGNPWDNFSYLKTAAIFAELRYPDVAHASADDIAANPLLENPTGMLEGRPAVKFLYAVLGRLVPGSLAIAGYPFLCGLMIAGLLAFAGFLQQVLARPGERRAIVAILLAGAYAGGFWGQYPADIDAWSSVAATPVLLAAWTLVLAILTAPAALPAERRVPILVLALAIAGALYLYPEGCIYHGLILAGVVAAAECPGLRLAGRRSLVILGAVVLSLLAAAVFWNGTAGFIAGQAQIATSQPIFWWQYFDAYLFGLDPDLNKSLSDAAGAALATLPAEAPLVPTRPIAFLTGGAGLLGAYFLTPGRYDAIDPLDAAKAVLLLAVLVGAAISLVVGWRSRLRSYRLLLGAVAIGLVGSMLLVERGQAWAAGKAISYIAPLLCLALTAPALIAARRQSAWLSAAPWCAAQAWFIALALSGLGNANGIRLPAPYPDWQSEGIKGDNRWDIAAQMARVKTCASVRVVALDEFFRDYASIALFEAHKPYAFEDQPGKAPLPARCRLVQAGLPIFMPGTGPPSGVMAFPIGLKTPGLFFAGVWQDGWLRAHANVKLALPGSSDLLHLAGEIPNFSPKITGGTMRVTVDSALVLDRPADAGPFELTVPIPPATGVRDIKLDMTGADALPADGRPVAWHLASIFLDSTAALTQDPTD